MAEAALRKELLRTVEEEAGELRQGKRSLQDPLAASEGLMEFAVEAFNQYFHDHLGVGISGFSQTDKEEVLQVAGSDRDADLPLYELVRLYVDFCNRWPDVLSLSYGGSPADFIEFRGELIPSLLSTLLDVSLESKEAELAMAIEKSKSAYDAAINEVWHAERAKP